MSAFMGFFSIFLLFGISALVVNPVGQDIRDRFSGAVEAFSRRNVTSSGRHGEHSRHRTSEDVPSSKDVVFSHFLHPWVLSYCCGFDTEGGKRRFKFNS